MTSICLSIPTNFRCSDLSLQQSNAILAVPFLDFIFCGAALWWNWDQLRRHQHTLTGESVFYVLLSILDYANRLGARKMASVASFGSFNKAIGALTAIPLVLYTVSLVMLARLDVFPLALPSKLHRPLNIILYGILPFMLLANELSGFIGVTYRILNAQLFLGYTSVHEQQVSDFFAGATLILLGLPQLALTFLCLFYISRAYSRGHGGGVIPGIGCVGFGLMLGTMETFLGFGPTTFSLIIARKVIRTLARGVILTGTIIGTDATQGFTLYPAVIRQMEEARPPGNLRLVISTPHTDTFARLSPAATAFHQNLARPRRSGVSGVEASSTFSDSSLGYLVDARRVPVENIAPSQVRGPVQHIVADQQTPEVRQDLTLRPVLSLPNPAARKTGLPPQPRMARNRSASESGGPRRPKPGFNAFRDSELALLPSRPNKPGDRVTVHFAGGDLRRTPVLELRLSDLSISSVESVMARIKQPDVGGSDEANASRDNSNINLKPYDEEQGMLDIPRTPVSARRFKYPAENASSGSDGSGSRSIMKDLSAKIVTLPSRPIAAQISRRLSAFMGQGGRWTPLVNRQSSESGHQPTLPHTAHNRDSVPSLPSTSRSQTPGRRGSEQESLWLRNGLQVPASPAAATERFSRDTSYTRPERKSTRRSHWSTATRSRYDDDGSVYSVPNSARIMEAQAVDVRPGPHWSTVYARYRSNSRPDETATETTLDSPYTPQTNTFGHGAPSRQRTRSSRKSHLFEMELNSGQGPPRKLYPSERRVSRIHPEQVSPPDDFGSRPRIAPKAITLETHRKSRSAESSQHSLPPRFQIPSIYSATAETSDGISPIDRRSEEIPITFKGVISRTPTVMANRRDAESVLLEHGHTPVPAGFDDYEVPMEDFVEGYEPEEAIQDSRAPVRKDSGVLGDDGDVVTGMAV